MDNILIINKGSNFLHELRNGLEPYKSQFKLLFATNVDEAIKLLKKDIIKVLITELKIPDIDILSFLTYISNNFSKIPCIAIIEKDRPDIWMDPEDECFFNYIEKPVIFDELANAIMYALDHYDECTPLSDKSGLPLSILLQLIEIESETRLLEIRSNHNEKGYIYLNDGVLYNAVCGDLKGEAAIQGMLQWKKTRIEFKNLPKEKIKRQIHTKINDFFSKNDKPNNETLDSNEERPSIESDINSESTEAEIEDELQEQDASNAPAIYQISENHLEERRHKKMALENEVFEPLKKISGFVGSIIYSGTGEVILADAPSTINTDEVGGLAIELYKNARAIAERMKMGIADLVEVRTESHYFLHACIVPGKGALGVLMLRDGNIGLMRHTMRRISESLVPDFS